MSKVYICLVAGLLGLPVWAQELPPGTNASPPGVTNASPTAPGGPPTAVQQEGVWVEDGTPAGASLSGPPYDPWIWTNAFWDGSAWVAPYSGSLMHLSPLAEGWHQHFFSELGLNLAVDSPDSLFTYICLPLTGAPTTVMLQWWAADGSGPDGGSWGHRAFWGDASVVTNSIYSSIYTNAFYAGPLPAPGQWARLSVPAGPVGLERQLVQGVSFGIYDGTAAWDRAGKLALDLGTNGLLSGQGPSGASGAPPLNGAGPLNPSGSCVNPPGVLAAWWRGENNCLDFLGLDPGTAQGYVSYVTGAVGYAFSLNGTNAYVKVPASTSLNVGTDTGLTIEGWVNPTSLNSQEPIVEWGNTYAWGVHFWLSVDAVGSGPGSIYANVMDVNGYRHILSTTQGVVHATSWQHVALTYDYASGEAVLYCNGSPFASTNLGVFTPQTSYDLYLGYRPLGGAQTYFSGGLDEISIYACALDYTEIQAIWAAGSAGKCTNQPGCAPQASSLVGWWQAEGDCQDTLGLDNGQAQGGLTYAAGMVGQAFTLNGTNADVKVPASTNLNIGTNTGLTIEGWVNPTSVSSQEPIVEWGNTYAWGVHFWLSVDAVGSGPGSIYANVMDVYSYGHILSTTQGVVSAGSWQHVALTYDYASGEAVLYCNGSPFASTNLGLFTPQTSYDLYLGYRPLDGAQTYFSGGLDEISIYACALSYTEIQAIYAARTAGKCLTSAPDLIAFSVAFAGNYVSSGTITGQISVAGGAPSYVAVLVDSTNYAGATWSAYNSAITVGLGANQGWHDVWVGLCGPLGSGPQAWRLYRINFDATPPALVLTAPGSSYTSQPVLQLAGYCPEPLASITYDLSNAAGWVTNQPGFVTAQYYDGTIWHFTTNFFQCFDIPLAAGNNTITLHATDLAGNLTVTNITYTFSTNGDVTPPAITLQWPQAGATISGSSITVRGQLDDPTASVAAQVAANGVTNTVAGWVERSGLFWVDGVPLSAGANLLTLTAVDAAGNSSATNVTVVQTNMTLTIGDFSAQDLTQGAVNLSGTIGSSAYTVWVNGARGVNNGNGTWSVQAAPLNQGGRVILQAVAIPNSDHGGNGTGGGGLPTNQNMGNPTSPGAVATEAQADQPFRPPYVQTYTNLFIDVFHMDAADLNNWDGVVEATNNLSWKDGQGGQQILVNIFGPRENNGACTTVSTWLATWWPTLVFGSYNTMCPVTGNSSGIADPPLIPLEHDDYDLTQWAPPGQTIPDWHEYIQRDQAVMRMQTGGRAVAGKQSLFWIWVTATGVLYDDWMPWLGQYSPPTTNIPPQFIQIGSLGCPDTDGNLFVALPDGTNLDVTPRLAGPLGSIQNYSFGISVSKLHMDLSAVTFNGYSSLLRDTNGAPYSPPHWTTNRESYPVLYVSGAQMATAPTSFTAKLDGQSIPCELVVKGQGGGYVLLGSSSAGLADFYCSATNNFATNLVQYINSLKLAWSYSVAGSNNWVPAGSSTNVIYVTLAQPTNAADYHRTVAHLACSQPGATTPQAAASNTWSFFPGPGNVKTWDGRTLYYYETNVPWANRVIDVAGLLATANGQCDSWRQLLQGAWALNGVQSTWMKAKPTATGANTFLVNRWTFGSPSLTNPPYIYNLELNPYGANGYTMVPSVSGDLTNAMGAPGQNSPTPAEKIFGAHFFPGLSFGGTTNYYDPSYGVTYTNDASFQTQDVAGYSVVTCPGNTNPFAYVKPVGTSVEIHISPAP